jgi:hypothetical protein
MVNLRENLCKVLRMASVSDKSCRENQNTHFTFKTIYPEIRAVYEIMWEIMVEPDGP